MIGSILQLPLAFYGQRRLTLRDFARNFWRDIARDIRPTPKSLTIEVNPALKTNYRKEYRTYLVTIQLGHSVSDMIAQSFYGGPSPVGGGYPTTSSYVQAIQQKEALKKEAAAMEQLAQVAAQEAQNPTAVQGQGMTKMQQDLLEGQRKRDMAEAEKLQAQAEEAKEAAQKIEEAQKIVQAQQSVETSQTATAAPAGPTAVQETPATPAPAATANPTTTAESTALQMEEQKEDLAELIAVRNALKNYNLRITRQPTLENDAMGDRITFEVAPNSFRDQGLNPNMRPIIEPSWF